MSFLDRFRGPDGLPVIRFAPDYSVDVPLFPQSDEVEALVPADLLARLVEWQHDFDRNFRWDTGWRSDEAKRDWAAEAVVLESELKEALAGRATLDVDLWPLNQTDLDLPDTH